MTALLDVAGYLIAQAHAFRGHDESDSFLNRGNFLEMIEWHKKKGMMRYGLHLRSYVH